MQNRICLKTELPEASLMPLRNSLPVIRIGLRPAQTVSLLARKAGVIGVYGPAEQATDRPGRQARQGNPDVICWPIVVTTSQYSGSLQMNGAK